MSRVSYSQGCSDLLSRQLKPGSLERYASSLWWKHINRQSFTRAKGLRKVSYDSILVCMKSLTLLIRQRKPDQYLTDVILAVVGLFFCNMLFYIVLIECGLQPQHVLMGPNDRFADLVKLSLSFKNVTAGIENTPSFQSWNPLFKHYYTFPDYGGSEALVQGNLTHFHHPPLSALILMLCGRFIFWTGSPTLAILLFLVLYLITVWWMICVGIPPDRRTTLVLFVVWFACLFTYPALLIFSRANYVNAGFTTVPLVGFMLATFGRRKAGFFALLALAVAANIKPNAIIFVAALPLVFGIRGALNPFLKLCAIFLGIFVPSYVAAHYLYPEYTIATFLKGVAIYKEVYIVGEGGTRFNSSLFGLVKNPMQFFRPGISFSVIMQTYYGLLFLLVAAICWNWWRVSRRSADVRKHRSERGRELERPLWPLPLAPYFLTSLYCLYSPVFADYHLLVFLAPLLLIFLDYQEWEAHFRSLAMVALASILMLSPKNYLFAMGVPLQVLINPAILYFSALWLSFSIPAEARQRMNQRGEFQTVEG